MSVYAIVVLFQPDEQLLPSVIKGITGNEVAEILLIDNSEIDNETLVSGIFQSLGKDNYTYIGLKRNVGIADAQNIGIRKAVENGASHIVFFDQDTVITDNLISSLMKGYAELEVNNYKIGAVGPRIVDRRTGNTYKARVDKGISVGEEGHITEVNQLISSGSLVKTSVFTETGGMEAALFIDAVDFEWCWRAGSMGYKHFLMENVSIEHELGINEHHFGSMKISVPSAFRCYYLYRNFLILLRRPYVPAYWKLSNGFKLLVKMIYYPAFLKNGGIYWMNIKKGIRDGFRKQL